MSSFKIIDYIKDFKNLNENSLKEINQLIEKYPYFHALYLLWIKNVQKLNLDVNKYLPLIAIRVVDRKILYEYLNKAVEDSQKVENEKPIECEVVENEKNNEIIDSEVVKGDLIESVSLNQVETVEQTIKEKEKNFKRKLSKNLKNNISTTLNSQIEDIKGGIDESLLFVTENNKVKDENTLTEEQTSKKEENLNIHDVIIGKEKPDIDRIKNYKDYLIERFIEKGQEKIVIQPEEMAEQKDISEDSVKEHEDFFTETLAKIFLKQKNYSKAIYAYEKLILKYPEKSDYFAKKIEEIKKLLNNN